MSLVKETVARNRAGHRVALASVCTAHPDVLDAALCLAQARGRPILIEATSNQVNQFGGYTGKTPADFAADVRARANALGVDPGLFELGGDHLGPQAWRKLPAETAMAKAHDMMGAYVEAGFTKIHLDCSEGCQGEPAQVDDDCAANRAAELARTCETAAPDPSTLTYVIGTEVPPPGGARADEPGGAITPTQPGNAARTLECHRRAFAQRGLDDAWTRVVALVVQPGLEFGPLHIDRFDTGQPDRLSQALQSQPSIAFEAHSTDYQYDAVFRALAERHFAILKVGPALTFAYRRAVYALDQLSPWYADERDGRAVAQAMEALMSANPDSWSSHYHGSAHDQYVQRHFGYADRIRYYWPNQPAQEVVRDLLDALPDRMAAPILQQAFSEETIARAQPLQAKAGSLAKALIWSEIQAALMPYLFEEQG